MKTKTQATNQSNGTAKMVEDFQRECVRRAEEELEQAVESALRRAGKTDRPVEVPPAQPLHRIERPQPAAGRSVIKLGLDVDKERVTGATQYDNGMIKPAATFKPNQLVAWVRERVQEGHVVWTVYEACGFGYTLHWKLTEALSPLGGRRGRTAWVSVSWSALLAKIRTCSALDYDGLAFHGNLMCAASARLLDNGGGIELSRCYLLFAAVRPGNLERIERIRFA